MVYTPMGYTLMVFIETSVFTRQIFELIPDADYRELQRWLITLPDAGALIPRSGGCRKVRWNTPHAGKRGGIRVIYYWMPKEERMLMLLAYSKTRNDNLTREQEKALARLVRQELRGGSHG